MSRSNGPGVPPNGWPADHRPNEVPDAYRDHVSTPQRVVPTGEYYVLGDHRSSSNDSRMWGTVPRHYIYGKAAFVYWPLDRMGLLR